MSGGTGVAIYVKGAEADRLACEPARLEDTCRTEAIGRRPTGRHARLPEAGEAKRRRVEARLARLAAIPGVDPSDPDAAIDDERGLPRA